MWVRSPRPESLPSPEDDSRDVEKTEDSGRDVVTFGAFGTLLVS